ncbi:MAG: hypothetical protein JWM96_829 [Alphaproteobacteria bacterium]|nr:hypothetical protein [Alphaproteobacteria bacterium]
MRVLFATSELYPFVKTGGLGDVAAGMPQAMDKIGVDIRYFLPGYPEIKKNLRHKKTIHDFDALFGQTSCRIVLGTLPGGIKAYILDAPGFFERSHPYLDEEGKDWEDNHLRFGAFCYAAAHLVQYDPKWAPDILHGNDWQCGLIPAYKAFGRLSFATIMTIHNIGYQGLFPAEYLSQLHLPPESLSVYGVEYYNQIGFLKAGLYYADHLTTVSPTYADEICTPEMGCGLEGLLVTRRHDLTGILNGIDGDIWDPRMDPALAFQYNEKTLAPKRQDKKVLLKELGLKGKEKEILLGFIGRLTPQKGIDLLLEALPLLEDQKLNLIIVGTGDAALEEQCRMVAEQYPDRVVAHIGYDEDLAHRVIAGADAIIVPSYFEPCGLVQMYALRYGALPIVRQTGGLADSVTPQTGFLFEGQTPQDLKNALLDAINLYYNAPKTWAKMQKTAMKQDFSWDASAKEYCSVYTRLLA